MKKRLLPVAALLILVAASCKPYDVDPVEQPSPERIDGWAPIYDTANTSKVIKAVAPRAIERGGKIYIKGNTLYQVEAGKGIHVIDITQPGVPVKKGFLMVVGCQEMAIQNETLYTNNLNDLVALDITDVAAPKLTDRVSGAFHIFDPFTPPSAGWHECADQSKGAVVGWEIKSLSFPQCR